jgi:hypothetical protein
MGNPALISPLIMLRTTLGHAMECWLIVYLAAGGVLALAGFGAIALLYSHLRECRRQLGLAQERGAQAHAALLAGCAGTQACARFDGPQMSR